MVGGKDLHAGPDLGTVADLHLHYVEDHAIEIHEHAIAERDVVAVVEVERWAYHAIAANCAQSFLQQVRMLLWRQADAAVIALHPVAGGGLVGLQFVIDSAVELAGEHFLFFGLWHRHSLSFARVFILP